MPSKRHAFRRAFAAFPIGVAMMMGQSGCIPIRGTEFRDAALPAIETGLNAIVDGVLNGLFAAIQPNPKTPDVTGGT